MQNDVSRQWALLTPLVPGDMLTAQAQQVESLGLSLDHLLRFDLDPASVSRISIGPWGAQVHSINERLYR